jgi:CubicO group peptidase (beta-lactamase class C family)
MLANGGSLGEVKILDPKTVRMMGSNFLPPDVYIGHNGTTADPDAGEGFGLDVAVILGETKTYPQGSMMWGGAAGTWFWVDPINHLHFVGMIQVFGGSLDRSMRTVSAELVYDAMGWGE